MSTLDQPSDLSPDGTGTAVPSTPPASGFEAELDGYVDALLPALSDFHLKIFDLAEPAWREYRSAAAYVELLRDEGFEVEEGSGDMPTAFHATFGSGRPEIGLYAEYDASPGYSQQAVTQRMPREGMHRYAPGFTDAHSALGVGALGAAIAVKRHLHATGTPGTVHLFGEPAEKVCGSKAVHAAKGYYDCLDAAISYHPLYENVALGEVMNCAYWAVVFTFECTDAEPWVSRAVDDAGFGAHNEVRSPGAVDALGMMLTATKYTQENMFPRTGLWSLNQVVLGAGNATADNLPARMTQIQYSWRSSRIDIQEQILEVLERTAKHAAGLTNCEVRMRWVTRTRPGLPNLVLSDLVHDQLGEVGPVPFSEDALAFGRALEAELGHQPSKDPFLEGIRRIVTPQEEDARVRATLPPWQDCTGADDFTEYSWQTPTVRFHTAKPLLRVTGGDMNHWANNAMNGLPAAIDPCWSYASKVIARCAVRLISDPGLLAEAHAEFDDRRAQADPRLLAPLLPADFVPPIELPWPEYVETHRGREWTLPTTTDFGALL
jgi:aminobenzoyl-glutamate utilization protein B